MTTQPIRFLTHLLKTGANTTGIPVPPDVLAKLGAGGRPAVAVSVNGYSYRSTVGVMGGQSLLPFSSAHREASGLQGGDTIEVEIALDTRSREVEAPEDLRNALHAAGAVPAFEKQAPSRRRADIENVTGAKTDETRARRIAAIVGKLQA